MASGDQGAPLKGGMLWLAAVMLAMANFVAVLDMTIANVSMPDISGALGISTSQGTWVITSYSVAEAIIVPLTGWLAGRFGSLRVFTTAMMLFGAFSALCGVSNSLEMLVLGRVMQGLSGGMLMPLSQTLLMRIFPKERAPAAMALWAMTTLVAPVAGGMALRYSGKTRGGGQGIDEIVDQNTYWFGPRFEEFKGQTEKLPCDQHWLLALAAPRPYILCNSLEDQYGNANAAAQTYLAARPVYAFLNVPENLGVNFRPGKHGMTGEDWSAILDFADEKLRGKKAARRFDELPRTISAK